MRNDCDDTFEFWDKRAQLFACWLHSCSSLGGPAVVWQRLHWHAHSGKGLGDKLRHAPAELGGIRGLLRRGPGPVAETPQFVLAGGAFAGAQDGKLMEFQNVVSKACQLVSIAAELAVMEKGLLKI